MEPFLSQHLNNHCSQSLILFTKLYAWPCLSVLIGHFISFCLGCALAFSFLEETSVLSSGNTALLLCATEESLFLEKIRTNKLPPENSLDLVFVYVTLLYQKYSRFFFCIYLRNRTVILLSYFL